MDRFDPFVKYADVYGDIINWEKDPMNKPQNQNKYFFSDGKTYYEQICKMLRLMSVFKEAFNQIYSNEDEISEAWENFVNNLSASVVEGSEPDVTLTWTDDSVNFEFTMVPGVPGEQGVGITSISFNSDYTMTITLSDGNTYTSMSLKGETGPQGPQGETGSGLQILDVYATLADLQSAHPTGQPGDAYQVGSGGNYILYIWSSSQSAWVQAGTLGTVSPYTSAPLMDGTASAGSQNLYARGDHVHPSDTSRASQEELDALIKTSQALIDQSFTYRESPAIQDGLARIDKIKGNTLAWNQILQNGNFENTSGWANNISGNTISASANELTIAINTLNQNTGIYGSRLYNRIVNHKYLFKLDLYVPHATTVRFGADSEFQRNVNTGWNTVYGISQSNLTTKTCTCYITATATQGYSTGESFKIRNYQCFDLTQMFGAGNEPTTVDEFTFLFPLSYYDYNVGSLLSFNGTGLKITGKNLFNINNYRSMDSAWTLTDGVLESSNNNYKNYVSETIVGTGNRYTLSFKYNVSQNRTYAIQIYNRTDNVQLRRFEFQSALTSYSINDVLESGKEYDIRVFGYSASSGTIKLYDVQLEIGSNATDYAKYIEPFNLSLPVMTYFPSGMKSAGSIRDELMDTRARTRVGTVTSSTAIRLDAQEKLAMLYENLPDALASEANEIYNATSIYQTYSLNDCRLVDYGIAIYGKSLWVRNKDCTTLADYQNWLANNPFTVNYELQTPTETDVDIDLSFKSYLDGTEQLLPVNGSVPSTSPIIADITYLSIDDAMEYIIDKLANVPENTQLILDALEDDVSDLQTEVGTLQTNVSGLQTSVGNINTNIGQLSSTVAGHTASISDMQSDITDLNTGLNDLEDTVTDNTSRIGTLETDLSTTDGQVQNLATSVSGLDSTVTAQGETVTALDNIIQDISNNPVVGSLGSHELGFVAAYVSATLAANTGTKVTIPKPTIFPNNYTPLFIVGMTTGSYNVSICEIPYSFGNRDSVDCRVWNHGGQQTTQITVYILCMRQRQSQ